VVEKEDPHVTSEHRARCRPTVSRLLAGAAKTIRDVRYCWLVPAAEAGSVTARPMGRLLHDPDEDEWTIRFVTAVVRARHQDLKRAGRVALLFQHDPSDAYVILIATQCCDRMRPKSAGAGSLTMTHIFLASWTRANAVFVEVAVECMELWIRGVTPEPFGSSTTRGSGGTRGAPGD